jgi:hypothetical protein
MKKLLLLMIPMFLVSCMGGINITRDNFKNADVVTMQLRESSDESMIKGGGWAIFTYSREIRNNVSTPTLISFHITKAVNPLMGNQDLTGKAVIKVNDASFNVGLGETSAVDVTTISGSPNYATGGTQINTSRHEEWNTRIQLTRQIEDAIKNAKTVAVRFYFGTSSMTFLLDEKSVAKVKEFLSAKPETAKK